MLIQYKLLSNRRFRPCSRWNDLTADEKIKFLLSECDRLREDRNEWRQMYVTLLREVVGVDHEHSDSQAPE